MQCRSVEESDECGEVLLAHGAVTVDVGATIALRGQAEPCGEVRGRCLPVPVHVRTGWYEDRGVPNARVIDQVCSDQAVLVHVLSPCDVQVATDDEGVEFDRFIGDPDDALLSEILEVVRDQAGGAHDGAGGIHAFGGSGVGPIGHREACGDASDPCDGFRVGELVILIAHRDARPQAVVDPRASAGIVLEWFVPPGLGPDRGSAVPRAVPEPSQVDVRGESRSNPRVVGLAQDGQPLASSKPGMQLPDRMGIASPSEHVARVRDGRRPGVHTTR